MKYQVLNILAQGGFHSGQALGQQLGISRSAVWKHIKALQALGVDCHSVTGKGYRLAQDTELLVREEILAALDADTSPRLSLLECHHEIDSTNAYLMARLGELESGSACLAEMQNQGRGRRGRVWASPFARNIYLSLYWRFQADPASLSTLSLVVGVALKRALQDLGVGEAQLKWPNDLLWQGRKLAGILLEMSGEASGDYHVVIGVGVNVNMSQASEAVAEIDQPWVDLASIVGRPLSRNQVAARLLHHLLQAIRSFEQHGGHSFMAEWRSYDAYANQSVVLHTPAGEVHGIARGVDANGALVLETAQGRQSFYSGEVSMRPLS